MNKVVDVEGITKIYRLYDKQSDRAKEAVHPFKKKYHTDFYALRDISLKIFEGETVGIIGRNGSGKSTLLKILTGVTTQTSGRVEVKGKVAALLELGAGLNPEMTGIDNIDLNGAMQGYSKQEMEGKMRSIIDFADIGEFINQPVKTYSSGMFVRLAFALAINIDPDILIVDEALSVGDIYFQAKCYRKFEEFKRRGKTIIFVTHDMNSVLKYCDRGIVMHNGEMLDEGSPKEMVDLYKKVIADMQRDTGRGNGLSHIPSIAEIWKDRMVLNPDMLVYGDGSAEIFDFAMFDDMGGIAQSVVKDRKCQIRMRVRMKGDVMNPIFAMTIKDVKGQEITGTNSKLEMIDVPLAENGSVFEITFEQPMFLQGGQYLVSFGCTRYNEQGELQVLHRLYDAFSFYVIASKFVVGIFDMGMTMTVERNDER